MGTVTSGETEEGIPARASRTGPGPLVSAAWVRERLGDADLRLVHVSVERDVYDREHIPGAVFSDLHVDLARRGTAPDTGAVEREYLVPERHEVAAVLGRWGVGPGDRIVLYDDVGRNRYAVRGAWLLRYRGWPRSRVHVLDGGLGAWKASGAPVTAAAESDREARPVTLGPDDPSVIASATDVMAWTETTGGDQRPRVLDVRTAGEYHGADVRARRGGHIPGADRLEWTSFLTEDGLFRTGQQIRAAADAVAGDASTIRATYCQGGVRAALAWFALHELAGLDVRNYAGSWEEWGNRDDTPVEAD